MKYLKKIVLASSAVLFGLALVFVSMPNMAKAANTISSTVYQDANSNGTVENIRLTLDENVTACAYEAGDWAVTVAGTINVTAITGITCTGTDAFLDVAVTAGAGITGGGTAPTITYTQAAGTADSVTLTSGAMTDKSSSPTDGAKPQIKTFDYLDADSDGKIDSFIATYTETVTAASVLGANDLTLTNVGDFTGAAFGALVTDLIVGSVTSTTVPLGTEATAKDTGDASGTIAISSQNLFSLTDGTNTNTTLGAQSQATFVDTAKPRIKTFTYQDADLDSKMDTMLVTYTEPVTAGTFLSANDLTLTNVGDFTGAAFGAAGADLVTGTVSSTSITLGTEATPVDTYEDSGLIAISSQNLFSLLDANGNNNTTLGAQATNATFVDGIKPLVSSVTPVDASTNQSNTADIVIVFSEPMATASLTASTFTTKDAGIDTGDTYTATWSNSNKTVNLAHAIYRQKGHVYTANITTGVTDVATNPMVSYSWTFTATPTRTSVAAYTPGDITAPTATSVSIEAGAASVASSNVTLTLAATGATQMIIANTPDFYAAAYEAYATTKAWVLNSGNGSRTVYVKFRDAAGNVTNIVSATTVVNSSATPATPATPAVPGVTPAVPATPATPGEGISTTPTPGVTVVSLFLNSIKYKSTGEDVKKLQTFLKDGGYYTLKIDGKYGPGTMKALKKFQKDNGLVPDGKFGPKTMKKVNELL